MIRTRSLSVLAFIAAALTACDSARESQVVGPQSDLIVTDPIEVVSTSAPVTTSTVTAVIDQKGGNLRNGDHILIVPRRAVLGATEFTFTAVGGDKIHVDLTAKNVATGAPVSVFAENLTLKLSYQNAIISDPSQLMIVWLVDTTTDGLKQPVPSYVDKYNQYVLGSLSHFSDYALAAD